MQRKTGRPVQFEITEQTSEAVVRWLEKKDLHKGEPLFPSRINRPRSMTTRQYARLLGSWLHAIGLDPLAYRTHSLRRTKTPMIYRRTGNLVAAGRPNPLDAVIPPEPPRGPGEDRQSPDASD
jgi:hypothetical protein